MYLFSLLTRTLTSLSIILWRYFDLSTISLTLAFLFGLSQGYWWFDDLQHFTVNISFLRLLFSMSFLCALQSLCYLWAFLVLPPLVQPSFLIAFSNILFLFYHLACSYHWLVMTILNTNVFSPFNLCGLKWTLLPTECHLFSQTDRFPNIDV